MSLLTLKKYKKYVLPIIITIIMSMVYKKYISSVDNDENMNNYNVVKQYLLSDSSLAQSSKPIIWIHIVYEKNGRWWPSFSSRTNQRPVQQQERLLQEYLLQNYSCLRLRCLLC